jgi:putative endonuclease
MPAKAGIQGDFPMPEYLKKPCVYILASDRNGTLYVGVTSDLERRIWLRRTEQIEGFTKRYAVHRLVYVETHETMDAAIVREKHIKKWRRAWKLELIEKTNPQMARPVRHAAELKPLDPRFRGGDGCGPHSALVGAL